MKDHGEKGAIEKWNGTYYGQIQVYMKLFGRTRAYHTVTTSGGREHMSVRTEYNAKFANHLMERGPTSLALTRPHHASAMTALSSRYGVITQIYVTARKRRK